MILSEGILFVLFAAISLLSAAVAVLLTGYLQNAIRKTRFSEPDDRVADARPSSDLPSVVVPIRYSFAHGRLVSDVPNNDPFLAADVDRTYAPTALSEAMAVLHPDLPDRISVLLSRGEPFHVIGHLGTDALSVAGSAESDRLTVTVAPAVDGELRASEVAERRFDAWQRVHSLSGDLQWIEIGKGKVKWCNDNYLRLSIELGLAAACDRKWPLDRIFGEQLDPAPPDGNHRRCHVHQDTDNVTHWFDVMPLRLSETEILFTARPVDKLVTAETSLRDFVQTLSKTFATLPVGLVVFDHKRELVLFNPALVSLCRLEPAFLTRRPTLRAFLDQLRELQRMPEPRDYRSWREEIDRIEEGAIHDRYLEIWTLPSGETLRVTGRPHPNRAIAFLFEDISQEVSLTRRFRTDLDLDRAILDDLPAGLIIFDRDGVVLRTNAVYRAMFRNRFDVARAEIPAKGGHQAVLQGAMRVWQEDFLPSRLWGEIRQFVRHETERAPWSEIVLERSGRRVHCRVAPLRGGHTVVWFLATDANWGDLLSGAAWMGEGDPVPNEVPADGRAESTGHGESVA
jgi:PAS domain-containing protein